MRDYDKPFLIEFPKIGGPALGYISVAEKENLPFEPKRIYWTYFTPEEVERGGHSHYDLQQILLAVAGKIEVTTELLSGEKETFILDKPNLGLYIPKMCWRNMRYTHNAVQICIASIEYDEKDYIREYSEFLDHGRKRTN
ncbi:dTDP-6-deoxy-3,4-keto-hexulose isomerase [Chryseobacterium sp. Leaf180]|jgi:hypothetical protein|uniref:sugar 3,4-ketoisomerase n=1 Tax=Chryseobacterium sp. Leaf180 TaxID=1736289 RepID=UPI0007016512|nr:FdtA/QdtA family cupin domain-containing protein [Chryseobacterium sp. Leaf180]KQR93862.1 dTDP-6-deoxy-3,4-keto-hexulose isomerase [Chryseobacterium sp. Leaf180]